MTAHIVQRVDRTVGTAYHDERGAQRFDDEIVAVHWDLADMPREHPMSAQKPPHFELEQLLFEVERLREAAPTSVLAYQFLQSRRSAHAQMNPASRLYVPTLDPEDGRPLIKTFRNDEIVLVDAVLLGSTER